ncbi:PREDICTED: CRIB domain-containing protein RIC4 isoform X2 [Tarenaya hassleriana]|uniref:CRIB domain-containing protein RIC4 isoform X2 n=1 Tax=Tarenaya hassleriana TaxID=28532 RepID=UPI00053C98C4|nr:PREDICTED: CRIB domain-containing protein RIC4 isoform X2 [Tarenaya hassleriana]
MRDRVERFVVLPFSVGCVSESSVAVAALCDSHKRSSKSHSVTSPPQEEEENMKNVFKYLSVSKPEISTGIHRLFKSFKTVSQLFAYKEEEEMVEELGMEIGMPTNVKHVTHIGWENTLTLGPDGRNWEDLISPEFMP